MGVWGVLRPGGTVEPGITIQQGCALARPRGPGIPLLVGSCFLKETEEEALLLAGLGNLKRQMVWPGQPSLGVTRLWPRLAQKEGSWSPSRGSLQPASLSPVALPGHWPSSAAPACSGSCCLGVP